MWNLVLTMICLGIVSAQESPQHLSEYMQRMALVYLENTHSEEVATARSLDNTSQEKILDDIESQINITLQHEDDGPQKEADQNFMLLLSKVRLLAGGAGAEIYQSKRDGPAVKAWTACYALAHVTAENGTIRPQNATDCEASYAIYSKSLKQKFELASRCSKFKKSKDQKACEAGKISPP